MLFGFVWLAILPASASLEDAQPRASEDVDGVRVVASLGALDEDGHLLARAEPNEVQFTSSRGR
jgi:hypothetical protein